MKNVYTRMDKIVPNTKSTMNPLILVDQLSVEFFHSLNPNRHYSRDESKWITNKLQTSSIIPVSSLWFVSLLPNIFLNFSIFSSLQIVKSSVKIVIEFQLADSLIFINFNWNND